MTQRRVLVTGAASGLGLAMARRFAAEGDLVLATDLATERPTAVDESMSYLPLDVTSDGDWEAALTWVSDTWGGLDILVNNAGIGSGGRIEVAPMSEWERVLDVNLLGVARGCRTMTPIFKAQGSGHIVNIASLAGLAHAPAMSTYNAAKAGVVALSETLRHELTPYGVTTSVVCPSFVRTNIAASMHSADSAIDATARRLVDGARTSPEEVAEIVLRAVARRRHLILTDVDGRVATLAKRYARPVFTAVMVNAGRRLARSAQTGTPTRLPGLRR